MGNEEQITGDGDWKEKLYRKRIEEELLCLERQRQADKNFTIDDLEHGLKDLYDADGADWLGRGEVQDINTSATIAAYEQFLSSWRSGRVVLGLGSNKGDSIKTIQSAISDLRDVIKNLKESSLYKSSPVGVIEQDDFINSAVIGDYDGSAQELLLAIHEIEKKHGRDRTKETRWGPRTLDIDILLFGDSPIKIESADSTKNLEVPHPRLHERLFALLPLLELHPDARTPQGKPYRTLAAALSGQSCEKYE
jgi:2-amino-4-hydroxy-6-hydroxymethyldihydropteridine diphosphokinase